MRCYGVVRLVNCCHINIGHNNVECRLVYASLQWHIRKIGLVCCPPPNTTTIPPWSESLDIPLGVTGSMPVFSTKMLQRELLCVSVAATL